MTEPTEADFITARRAALQCVDAAAAALNDARLAGFHLDDGDGLALKMHVRMLSGGLHLAEEALPAVEAMLCREASLSSGGVTSDNAHRLAFNHAREVWSDMDRAANGTGYMGGLLGRPQWLSIDHDAVLSHRQAVYAKLRERPPFDHRLVHAEIIVESKRAIASLERPLSLAERMRQACEGKPKQVALVAFMADRVLATFDALQDAGVCDPKCRDRAEAIEKTMRRTNESLEAKGVPIKFRVDSGTVVKDG